MSEMTELQTYVQMERALRRLRSKQLIHGPSFKNGRVCATRLLFLHLNNRQKMRCITALDVHSAVAMQYAAPNNDAYGAILDINEEYPTPVNVFEKESWRNDAPTSKKRYNHVLSFVRRKVRELTK